MILILFILSHWHFLHFIKKGRLDAFLKFFIVENKSLLIEDLALTDMVLDWLTTLTSYKMRNFRYGSTFIVLRIATHMVNELAAFERAIIETDERIAMLEKGRGSAVRAQREERIEYRNQIAEHSQRLLEYVRKITQGVATLRHLDTVSSIRVLVVEAIGSWILSFGKVFAETSYTRYLGWHLNDSDASVRHKTLAVINRIYATQPVDGEGSMSLFSKHFADRILQMAQDRNDEVVIEAVRVLHYLYDQGLLQDDRELYVCNLVYSANKTVAQASGRFLAQALIASQLQILLDAAGVSDDASRRRLEILLLLRFRARTKTVGIEGMDLLVDSLWDEAPVLQDWDTYLALLRQTNNAATEEEEEDGRELTDTTLDTEEEAFLLQMLAAAVRRATGTLDIVGRAVDSVDADTAAANRAALTDKLLPALPELLTKYAAESNKAVDLVDVLQGLELQAFTLPTHKTALHKTLDFLQDQFLRSTSTDMLQACVAALHALDSADLLLHAAVVRER